MLANVSFPNIQNQTYVLLLPLDTQSSWYNMKTLMNEVLVKVHDIEVAGPYDLKYGFAITPRASKWDQKANKPYSELNNLSYTGIVWHSHPWSWTNIKQAPVNAFPSIEDLDWVIQQPTLISVIITHRGIFVLGALRPPEFMKKVNGKDMYKVVGQLLKLPIDNPSALEYGFTQNNTSLINAWANQFDIFINHIPFDAAFDLDNLNRVIQEIYRLRTF